MWTYVTSIVLNLALLGHSQPTVEGDSWKDVDIPLEDHQTMKRPFGSGLFTYGKRGADDNNPHGEIEKRILLRQAIFDGSLGKRDVISPGDDEQSPDDTEDADEELVKRAFGSLFSSNGYFSRNLPNTGSRNDFNNYRISDSKRTQGYFGLGNFGKSGLGRYGKRGYGRLGLGKYGKRGYGSLGLGKYGKRGYGSLGLGKYGKRYGFSELGKYGKRRGLLDLGKYGKRYGSLDLGKYGKRGGYLGLGRYGKRGGFLDLGRYGKRRYGMLGLGKYGKRDYGYLGLGKYGKRGIPFDSLGKYGKRYDFGLFGNGINNAVDTANELDEKRGFRLKGLGKYGKRVYSDLSDRLNDSGTEDDLAYLSRGRLEKRAFGNLLSYRVGKRSQDDLATQEDYGNDDSDNENMYAKSASDRHKKSE